MVESNLSAAPITPISLSPGAEILMESIVILPHIRLLCWLYQANSNVLIIMKASEVKVSTSSIEGALNPESKTR